ncbi:hypothetical protein E1263_17070 [Kribbella antibiotica]|uniref:Uncharacterized protein n=1 Tax=Kribbella antibiotica TaxID=190195 RepID=A0A4R4ZLX9_9ACTN|nr:neutral zinc metallopeptidase [Kribbella antibiotica]TDD58894.1 hypothetical protein E1263_17070 [Kribbella antibiotica]
MRSSLTRLAIGVLAVGLLAGCGPKDSPVAEQPTPSATPTPTPTPSPTPTGPPEDGLVRNSIYAAGEVAEVKCALPTTKLANQQAVIGYAAAFVGCLNKAWEPVLEKADKVFVPAKVVPAVVGTKSPCDEIRATSAAHYCSSDSSIYLKWSSSVENQASAQEDAREELQFVIAGLYGYHVQSAAGVEEPYAKRYATATSAAAKLLESKRYQIQARCFAAAFYGANQKSLALDKGFIIYYGTFGFAKDKKNDGQQNSWLAKGWLGKSANACNTWAASPKQIS